MAPGSGDCKCGRVDSLRLVDALDDRPRPGSRGFSRIAGPQASRQGPLAQFLLDRLLGKLAGVDAELLLNHLRVLLVIDLVGQLLKRPLDVFVLALLAEEVDDLLLDGKRPRPAGWGAWSIAANRRRRVAMSSVAATATATPSGHSRRTKGGCVHVWPKGSGLSFAPPGWRNWSYAPDLKSGVSLEA
jgi:hypothetical protein